jgi:hypothetical protein
MDDNNFISFKQETSKTPSFNFTNSLPSSPSPSQSSFSSPFAIASQTDLKRFINSKSSMLNTNNNMTKLQKSSHFLMNDILSNNTETSNSASFFMNLNKLSGRGYFSNSNPSSNLDMFNASYAIQNGADHSAAFSLFKPENMMLNQSICKPKPFPSLSYGPSANSSIHEIYSYY